MNITGRQTTCEQGPYVSREWPGPRPQALLHGGSSTSVQNVNKSTVSALNFGAGLRVLRIFRHSDAGSAPRTRQFDIQREHLRCSILGDEPRQGMIPATPS